MTNWLAGQRLTADRLNDNTLQTSTTTGATAAAGWTVVAFSGRKVNGITTVSLVCSLNAGSIGEVATNTGNISDNGMGTLPVGWRPPEQIECIWDSGFNDGGASISTAGVVTLRTTSGNLGIAAGHAPRISASWISENG